MIGLSAAADVVGPPDLRPGATRRAVPDVLRRPAWVGLSGAVVVAGRFVPTPEPLLADVAAGAAAVAMLLGGWAALPSARLRRCAIVMLGIATCWSAAQISALPSGPWAFISLAVLQPLGGLLVSYLVLLWPRAALGNRVEVWWVRLSFTIAPVLALLFAATVPAPDAPRGTWWPNWGSAELNALVGLLLWGLDAVALLLLIGLVLLRFHRSSRLGRQEQLPVLVTAAAVLVSSLGVPVAELTTGGWPPWAAITDNFLMVAIPLSFLASVGVRRLQRALAVERLLRPGADDDAVAVERALAHALGDRDLALSLWSASREAFLAPDGQPAPAASRETVEVRGAGGVPLARLEVSANVADRADLVEALAGAAGVALDNARLQAELRAQERDARVTEERLARLLPGGVAERLRRDPEALTRTERLTATVLMSDVRGYSALAERTSPAALAAALDEHRRAMNEEILHNAGTVVQYVGDAVLAVFTDAQGPGHAERALRSALGMQQAQRRLDEEWARRGMPPFGLGIGLSTGEVAVAFLGSAERAEYTVVGDTVNLAARLTDAARPAGTVVADRATVDAASGAWDAEPLAPMLVKGRSAEVTACRIGGAVRS